VHVADPRFWVLAAIVAGAFAVEATTGFGSTVITLTLAVHLFPLDVLLPTLVPLGLVLSTTIVSRQHAHVDRALLLRRVLPLMGLGVAAGLAVFEVASNEALRRVFGAFVVWVAATELWRLRGGAATGGSRPLRPWVEQAALLGAGVIHGIFASGGPLLVWTLGRQGLEKRAFRATLSSIWLALGVVLTAAYAVSGRLTGGALVATAALVPVLAVAVPLGEWAHVRLDETRFRRIVFVLLLGAGLTNAL
jgi:uncharacterized membrane protein YfcA